MCRLSGVVSELLGYVREENAPSAESVASRAAAAAASASAKGVHASIVPSANPEADDKMRHEMERLRQSRGPSLLEQHQQRLADDAKRGGGDKRKAKGGWDRCVVQTESSDGLHGQANKCVCAFIRGGRSSSLCTCAVTDRERDLEARRGISNDEATRIIEASKKINAKFTAPTITRQFL